MALDLEPHAFVAAFKGATASSISFLDSSLIVALFTGKVTLSLERVTV